MMEPPKLSREDVLRLFWHRTRKCAVPRTSAEMAEALNSTIIGVANTCRNLSRDGLVIVHKRRYSNDGMPQAGTITEYSVTHAGARQARAIAEAGQ